MPCLSLTKFFKIVLNKTINTICPHCLHLRNTVLYIGEVGVKRKPNNTMALGKNAQNSFDVALFIIMECCRHIRKIPYMGFMHIFGF